MTDDINHSYLNTTPLPARKRRGTSLLGLAMRGYAALSGLAPPRPLLIYQTSLNDNRQDDLMVIFLSPHSLPRHNGGDPSSLHF